MADEAVTLRDINWRETFPFTHVFRAFRVAIHPSKLFLALLAIACLWCGGLILDSVWPHRSNVIANEAALLESGARADELERARRRMASSMTPEDAAAFAEYERASQAAAGNAGIFETFFSYEIKAADNVLMFRAMPFDSIWHFLVDGPLWLWKYHWLFALIYTAWFLLIWSIFGGAISRIAAVHVARDEKISVRHAISFSVGKILSFIFAPVIPVFIVLGIGVLISIVSTVLLHIPYVGPPIAGLFFFLALIGGFVIALVILGTIGGFNLMYPTIAVEGSDSFDAISRSFSYVFARPWRMLWYTLVAVVYGAICYLFVRFFVWLVLTVTWFFMTWFLGGHNVNQPADVWPRIFPHPLDPLKPLPYTPDYDHLKGSEAAAAGLIVWWNYLLIGLIGAFAVSFYFSANTIVYYLMRRQVDATELDDVYVEETEDELEEPAAGAPGAGTTVVESTTVRVYETPADAAPGASAAPPEGPSTPSDESPRT